jgi:HEAT repeat protein
MQPWEREREAALLALAHAKEPGERREAAELLHELAAESPERWPSFVEVLPRLLTDTQGGVRRVGVALCALLLSPEEAERALGARLEDASEEVRVEAAGQLADLARPSARPSLAQALQDASFAVRFEAARGMASLHHGAGLDVLVEGLELDDYRFRALGALGELGDPRAVSAVQRVFRRWFLPGFERTQAAGTLARLGDPDGQRHLLERAGGSWQPDRALAVELVGEVKAPGALQLLCEILMNPKDLCRGAAARGLGRLGDPAAGAPLLKVLKEESAGDDLRLDAAEGLCLLKHPELRSTAEAVLPSLATKSARDELKALLGECA